MFLDTPLETNINDLPDVLFKYIFELVGEQKAYVCGRSFNRDTLQRLREKNLEQEATKRLEIQLNEHDIKLGYEDMLGALVGTRTYRLFGQESLLHLPTHFRDDVITSERKHRKLHSQLASIIKRRFSIMSAIGCELRNAVEYSDTESDDEAMAYDSEVEQLSRYGRLEAMISDDEDEDEEL